MPFGQAPLTQTLQKVHYTVLIRLLPFFGGTARMSPVTGIQLGVSGGSGVTRNTQQRAERVEWIEATIEAKRVLIEIGL